MIATDMHHVILQAVVDSFTVVPINGQIFNWDSLAGSITQYMTDLFVIGFRIFLPIFACMMILNCILGILAKVATTDEYVCSWYADENTGWFWSFISYNFTFAWNRQFYIYRNEKDDGFIYRGNVLRWNGKTDYYLHMTFSGSQKMDPEGKNRAGNRKEVKRSTRGW